MPTTTPTRAMPGAAARVRAAAQRTGRIARRVMERFLGRASRAPDSLPIGPGRCVDGRQQLSRCSKMGGGTMA
jgi:hypothetical protein